MKNATRSTPSKAIVLEIAERNDADPTEMPPLYATIDPEALDNVVQNRGTDHVDFQYNGFQVTVSGPNRISIQKPQNATSDERADDSTSTVEKADE